MNSVPKLTTIRTVDLYLRNLAANNWGSIHVPVSVKNWGSVPESDNNWGSVPDNNWGSIPVPVPVSVKN